MIGYESYVTINSAIALATSADISVQRSPILSNALYGSSRNTNGTTPLQQAHYYDWKTVTASVTIDVNEAFLEILKSMMTHRDTSVNLYLNSRRTGIKNIANAYWESISITASQDSAMSATINFIALECDSYIVGKFSDYFDNTTGMLDCTEMATINPLNPLQGNMDPVPFWKTDITEINNVKGWTFNLSQTIVKFNGCMNYKDVSAIEPYILGFGLMTSDMKIDTLLPETTPTGDWNMSDIYAGATIVSGRHSLTLNIDNAAYLTMTGELTKNSDPFQGNTSVDNLTWDYQIYSFT